MKRIVSALLALLVWAGAQAQEIRTNYTLDGITHISAEESSVKADIPLTMRLEQVVFSDGAKIYLLHLKLEQKTSISAPKGVKMALTLGNGGLVRLDQMGKDSPTKRRLDNGFFHNRLSYAMEEKDLRKIMGGVSSADIITGWEPDDYVQVNFQDGAFAEVIGAQKKAIDAVKNSTVALSTTLESYSETAGSVLSASSPVVAKGAENMYNVLLNYIYYKNTDGEDFDLAFAIGTDRKINVPLDATVTFEFADGESMALRNTADDVNFVRLSPATDQVRRLSYSPVKSIRITDENGETILEDSFSAKDNFHAAVRLQRELLLSASPR